MNGIIRCENIHKIYNEARPHEVRALSDVNAEVEKGAITIFRGPSGSGKTTLLSIIGAIDRPTKGNVYIGGKDIANFSDNALSLLRRKFFGFVFQNFSLIPRMPAWENVSYPLIPFGINEKERRERALRLLDKFGLSQRAGHTPEELSGGEQQRVAISRALICDPDALIMDEPTSNIDEDSVFLLIDIIKRLKAEGKTIIISSHDEALFPIADVMFTLRQGRLDT
jgi:putative ABC transport system ATP-binding protein